MRIFKTRHFSKWAKKEKLCDHILWQVADEIEKGLTGNKLGGNVYKKRISIHGRGKRGGVRTILAYQANQKLFFIYGYAKNEKENITEEELKAAKMLAKELLEYSDSQLISLFIENVLIEVNYEK